MPTGSGHDGCTTHLLKKISGGRLADCGELPTEPPSGNFREGELDR
jgi:hypothetical protein